jgi:uncharacterized membrane protein HdeD (DUF308 family)
MDITTFYLLFSSTITFMLFALYSKHKTLMAVAGVFFIIIGVFILTSPLEFISGEVINYAP